MSRNLASRLAPSGTSPEGGDELTIWERKGKESWEGKSHGQTALTVFCGVSVDDNGAVVLDVTHRLS